MEIKKILVGSIMATSIAVAGMAGALAGATLMPKEVEVLKEISVPYPVFLNKTIEVEVEVPVEVIKEIEIEKIVEVDNKNLDKAIEFIKDEVDEDITMDYILFEIDSKMEAEKYISDNIIKLLDSEDMFDRLGLLEDYRKSEISIRKISEPVIDYRDFDRKDLELKYEVRIRADQPSERAEYFDLEIMIPFEKGKLVKEDIVLKEI